MFRHCPKLLSHSSSSSCLTRHPGRSHSSPHSPYFVTTPIFYVNSSPHLGHLYTALLADAQARFQSLRGRRALLTTGTDEHGLKVQRAADERGEEPGHFCNRVSAQYRDLFGRCGVGYADFVRTSEKRHRRTVERLWKRLAEGGHVEKASYEGWYCMPDETFLSESQTEVKGHEDGEGARVSVESGHPVEWVQEDNYVFNLGKFKPAIQKWLEESNVIQPALFKGHVRSLLSEESSLDKLSISRPHWRLWWGIPVPDDPGQVVYVWLDALANYLTVCEGKSPVSPSWPADVHIIGKDILKFHAIYWPAFLMAAGLPLPRLVRVHSHWMVDGEKMSKSKGNVVDPVDLAERFTSEGLRYFLLREGVPHSDGNFSEKKMTNYLNSELANTLGNLLSRCTAKAFRKDPLGNTKVDLEASCSGKAGDLLQELRSLPWRVESHYTDFEYYLGVDLIMEVLRNTNGFIQEERPWELAREGQHERLAVVLKVAYESLRICGILMQPITPTLSGRLLDTLRVEKRTWDDAKRTIVDQNLSCVSGERCVLFNRVKVAEY